MMSINEIAWAIKRNDFQPRDLFTMRPLVAKARELEESKNYEGATALWSRMYKNRVRKLQAGLNLLRLSRQKKTILKVDTILNDLKKNYSSTFNVWLESAKFFLEKENYDAAYNDLTRTLALKKDNPSIYNLYITSAEQIGKEKEIYPEIKKAFIANIGDERMAATYFRIVSLVGDKDLMNDAISLIENRDFESLKLVSKEIMRMLWLILEQDLQITEEGHKNPIDLEHRAQAIQNPRECLKGWYNSSLSEAFEKVMLANKTKAVKRERSKVLFVSYVNWNFMQPIVESMDKEQGVEVRTLNLSNLNLKGERSPFSIAGQVIFNPSQKISLNDLPSYCRELFQWADVVFVEWANQAAVWMSWLLPKETKLVVRVHSYEAFTANPLFVNWANVDVLCSVSPHILDYMSDLARLERFDTEKKVIPNLNYHEDVSTQKKTALDCSLGMIGYNNKNKNPMLALELVLKLRERGMNSKLYLMGHPFDEDIESESEKTYYESFSNFVKEQQLENQLEFIPFNPEIDKGIEQFNFILSCSEREGTHESVIQSMLRSTIPVIRKWPILKQYESVEKIYNERWIFNDVNEMADFIYASCESGQIKALQKEARIEADENYNFEKVWAEYKRAILS